VRGWNNEWRVSDRVRDGVGGGGGEVSIDGWSLGGIERVYLFACF
jgi:hypothetical protein